MRAGAARVRRGTQGHVAEPRNPRSAPTWRDIYIKFIIDIIKVFFVLPYMGRVNPYRSSGLINPTISSLFFSVGSHTLFNMQDVARGGASDQDLSAPIKGEIHGFKAKPRALFTSYNGRINATWQHLMARSSEDVVHRRSKNPCSFK